MAIFKRVLAVSLVLVSMTLLAENVGTYTCSECSFSTPISGPDETNFIRTVVNNDVTSWVDSNGDPRSVTLCNGSVCVEYMWIRMTGLWYQVGGNGNSGGGSDGDGSSGGGDGFNPFDDPYCFSAFSCDNTGMG